MHLFEGSHVVLFVVSVAEYDEVGEDGKTNALREAMSVLKDVLAEPALKDCHFVVFLNKVRCKLTRVLCSMHQRLCVRYS